MFNSSHRVLTDTEISVLKKMLEFALIKREINETELQNCFYESCKKMQLKWNLNEPY